MKVEIIEKGSVDLTEKKVSPVTELLKKANELGNSQMMKIELEDWRDAARVVNNIRSHIKNNGYKLKPSRRENIIYIYSES